MSLCALAEADLYKMQKISVKTAHIGVYPGEEEHSRVVFA
jgi:hypothetical protein